MILEAKARPEKRTRIDDFAVSLKLTTFSLFVREKFKSISVPLLVSLRSFRDEPEIRRKYLRTNKNNFPRYVSLVSCLVKTQRNFHYGKFFSSSEEKETGCCDSETEKKREEKVNKEEKRT